MAYRKPKDSTVPDLTPEQQALAADNMGLVRGVLRVYFPYIPAQTEWYDEAELEGRVGLCKAAGRYREGAGWKFSTYASVCIKRHLWGWVARWQGNGFRGLNKRPLRAVHLDGEVWDLVAGRAADGRADPFTLGDLEPLVRRLPAQKQLVVRAVYQEGQIGPEIGRRLGVSTSWVNQVHREALNDLREMADAAKVV